MADPINSNLISNTCGEVISSNCVTWAGPAVSGTCRGASLTDVIFTLNNTISNCCNGVGACYTGNWVDFSSSIPLSGNNGGGLAWSISGFGNQFATGTGTEDVPQYKWTQQNDLKIRGSFYFNVTPTNPISQTFIKVPLTTLPLNCFPANGNLSQTILVSTDAFNSSQQITIVTRGFLTIEPSTGILYFNFSLAHLDIPAFFVGVYMGGTTFNLA
jgi:hypothetical protein